MRTSILVGAHNEGDHLWKTVESILDTLGKLDGEIIVADDGSTDGSIEELRKHFPRIAVVEQKERAGVGAARTLAAGHARGETLIFLDGHTKPEPGALKRLVSSVEKTDGEAVITPQIVGLDETTWRSRPQQMGNGYAMDLETFDSWWLPQKKMKEVKVGKQSFYESPAFVGCAVAVSRDLYDRLWGFDPHMRQWGMEDLDFALKAWTMGSRVLHDPGATVAHRFQRQFMNYEVGPEYPLANQIRMARKHFTQSVWEDWVQRGQQQQRLRLKNHPEGLWAAAWQIYQKDQHSVEHERSYLLSHREMDEFGYAKRFERPWPTMGEAGAKALLAQPSIPSHILYAEAMATYCPDTITSMTAASQPPNTDRTTIGIGEVVTLSYSGPTPTWAIDGPGSLVTSGSSATYQADFDSAATVTITATSSEGCVATIVFSVITPTIVTNSVISTVHRSTYDIGMCLNVFLGPDTVNFYALSWAEENGPFTADGCYSCSDGQCHCAACGTACSLLTLSDTVTPGYGTQVLAVDTATTGDCNNGAVFGTISIVIQNDYELPTVGILRSFYGNTQTGDCNGLGTLTISKGGAMYSCSINPPFTPAGPNPCA